MGRQAGRRPGWVVWLVLAVLVVGILALVGARVFGKVDAVYNEAKTIPEDIKTAASCLLQGDCDGADIAVAHMDMTITRLEKTLTLPLWRTAARVKIVREDLATVQQLLPLVRDASDNILKPAIATLRTSPLPGLTPSEEGAAPFDPAAAAANYTQLAQAALPAAERCVEALRALPRFHIGKLERKIAPVRELLPLADALLLLGHDAVDKLLVPLDETLRAVPLPESGGLSLSTLKELGDGVDAYLTLAERLLPEALRCAQGVLELPEEALAAAVERVPALGTALTALESYLPLAREAVDTLALPGLAALRETPLTTLMPESGKINVRALASYLTLAERLMPRVRQLTEELEQYPAGESERLNALMEKLKGKLNSVIALYDRAEEYLPLIRAFLGGGEDRLYLLAAQNTAEIRACGGFPGSIGTVEIREGVLAFGEFDTVYSVLPGAVRSPKLEAELFSGMVGAYRDAVYNPYFPWVAELWSSGYAATHGIRVDGVISATPAVIQDLLGVAGAVTLMDGTVLDGENATRILQHDLYMEYFAHDDAGSQNARTADELFAETAKLTVKQLFSSLSLSSLEAYLDVFEKRREDRVIMLWMADPEQQKLVEAARCDGGFPNDPAEPKIGVYFSLFNPSKLGWYLDMDIAVGEAAVNADGSRAYPVTVTLTNILDEQTRRTASAYVFGEFFGQMRSYVYFVAPAGGTVSDFNYDRASGLFVRESSYQGFPLGYALSFSIEPGASVSVSFTATTAPGAQAPLGVTHTPTLQEYR